MKHGLRKSGLAALILMAALPCVSWLPPSASAQDEWPRKFENPQGEVLVYQPQLEDFNEDKLVARAAVSARKKEMKEPVFGAIWIDALVSVDRDTRMARIYDIKVTDAKFPSATEEQAARVKDFINSQIEGDVETIALDRLVAAMDLVEKLRDVDERIKNDPPKVLYRSQPAVLVLLDGEPRLLTVPDSTLMRVVNTPFVMFYEPSDKAYFLKAGETWASSLALQGPYTAVESLPKPLKDLDEKARREAAKEAAELEGKPVQAKAGEPEKKVDLTKAGALPEIVVSTVPAELIVTEGEPQYTPIEKTNLLFVSNTEDNIFMDTADKQYYALLSGRWFKSVSLEKGPWSYVPSTGLPPDFARIPEGSVKGFVLVSVAGTDQARDAVMDSYIPQTAAIDRKNATIEIQYDGEPKFEKIPDVEVEYAVNTQQAVFKAKGKYYACVDAVWYESTSPKGPWEVSVEVAGDIYRIPPSNPHYNAKYVKVYDSTDDVAYVGYTPGYTGSYVDNGAIVYGTGYSYPAYSTPTTYIPYPTTYGYSAVYNPYQAVWGYQPVYYNPYSWLAPAVVGVGVGLAVSAIYNSWWDDWRYPAYRGWWGGGGYRYHNVHHHHHYHHRNANWRPRPTPYWRPGDRATWRPGDRPGFRPGGRPGRPGDRPGLRPGDRPGRPGQLPAQRANLYNRPGMENKLADASRLQRPGRADRVQGRPGATRPAGESVQGSRPGAERPAARPARGEARRDRAARPATEQMRKNNVYTDRDGNVYRRDSKGNWQQRDARGWSNVDRSARDQARQKPAAASRDRVRQRPADADRATREQAARPAQRSSADTNRLNREFRARERGAERTNQFNRSQSFQPRSSVEGRARGGGSRGGGSSLRSGGRGGDRSAGGGRGGGRAGGEGRGGRR